MFGGDWLYGVMIAFLYVYTWYWSAGIFYEAGLDQERRIRLKSLRRAVVVNPGDVRGIEGSRFGGGFGFLKLKIPRESVYIFCHRRNEALEAIIREIRRANPLVRTVRL